MGKMRSRLKRNVKGKKWPKGQSSTSNPENMKHRLKAKSRFFQANLSLAQTDPPKPGTLTLDAVLKHDARQFYSSKSNEPTVNDVAGSLKHFSIDDNEMASESHWGTFKTFQTFASNYSTCSNVSFKKLLCGFRASSDLHKEMLAILTALTEIIKERGGTESSTEYFILLMETIDASTNDSETIACVSLLGMGIKSVPAVVLRKRFSETAKSLMDLLQRYIESSNQSVIKTIIGCLSILLRALDYMSWTYSSTMQYIDVLLTLTVHTKPKIRKSAQHAIISIVHCSSFMLPEVVNDEQDINIITEKPKIKFHPVGSRIVKFCLNQFRPEALSNSQTSVLHTLALIKETMSRFKTDDIKNVCESLLSLMTATNVLLRTNCLQALHSLFASRTENLSGILCAKLLSAIYEYRPDRTDARQTVAWLTVLKEGHIHLAQLDLGLCVNSLPRFVDTCTSELWMSDRLEIVIGVSNAIKEILIDCIKPSCLTQELADIYRVPVGKVIQCISKALSSPFGDMVKYVILSCSILFECAGKYFSNELTTPLSTLANRYGTESSLRLQIEHAIISAIKSIGPENVLKTIPLVDSKGEVIIEKSWLLPLLREGTDGASFQFFKENILSVALHCNSKWTNYAQTNQVALAHTYELLCCQLWGLLPGFCRNPSDPENFRLIAPTLGNALDNNPEFRAPILDGIIELISNGNEDIKKSLSKYAKNFIPRLFNIYAQKPTSTYEADLRKKVFEVLKMYLSISSEKVLLELYETSKEQLLSTTPGIFENNAIYDINSLLVTYQTKEIIQKFYTKYIVPVLKAEKCKVVAKDDQKLKRQQRKTYELLRDILSDDKEQCQMFVAKNCNSIQKLLLEVFNTSCSVCQAARLKCLKILIELNKDVTVEDKIVSKSIPEAIVSFKEFSTKKENISQELILLIGDLYQEADKLNDFIDIVMAGFGGDDILITNTILSLRSIVQHFTGNLTINTLEFILEQLAVFLVQKKRPQAEASVAFLITFTKVLPSPLVANHLEVIMRSLSAMVPDTKRYCRLQIGYLLKKLCKRFTAEELIKFVPGNDEITNKRLKKIQKQLRRESRNKISEKNSNDDNMEDEFVSGLEKKSMTIDDILEDSDSDLPNDDDDNEMEHDGKNKTKKKQSTFIKEGPEEIVDLADIKAIGSVLTNRPNQGVLASKSEKKEKVVNRGFKTAEDGRLIITDKFRDRSNNDSSEDDDDETDKDALNATSKLGLEDDSSDDEDLTKITKAKRKASDSASVVTGKSGTSKYTAGGKGIHRNTNGSVKSGYSGVSRMSVTTNKSEYKSAKAQGDMKKKGKLDPYAYIPLSRNTLNKRKRSKNAGQFKNIVQGARKGALKGVKNKISKSYKK